MNLVVRALFVEQLPIDQYADALQIGQATHTTNVSNMNVKSMMTVHLPKLVYQMNVSILVIELFVDQEQNVKRKLIVPSATALLVLKEIRWFHVQKLDVLLIQNVHSMKNVII